MPRRPTPTSESTPLPTLAEVNRSSRTPLLAGVMAGATVVTVGGAMASPHPPVCSATRPGELEAHAPNVASSLARLELSNTLREIGQALGVVRHGTLRGLTAGEMRRVEPTPAPTPPPTPPVEPEVRTAGEAVRVGVTPPVQRSSVPPELTRQTSGGGVVTTVTTRPPRTGTSIRGGRRPVRPGS